MKRTPAFRGAFASSEKFFSTPYFLLYLLSKDGHKLPAGIMTVKDAADALEKYLLKGE